MGTYEGTFSISFRVNAESEDDSVDILYNELDRVILHGIPAAAFALHDDIIEIESDETKIANGELSFDNYNVEGK